MVSDAALSHGSIKFDDGLRPPLIGGSGGPAGHGPATARAARWLACRPLFQ